MRPTVAEVMLDVAQCLAQRATCAKLAVGCVLTDKLGRIVGSGYNGVPRGLAHCTDIPCAGATAPKGADLCQGVHAEQNALLMCRDSEQIHTCYTTHAPCLRCAKMLLNTSCLVIIYHNNDVEVAAKALWMGANRSWLQINQITGSLRPIV